MGNKTSQAEHRKCHVKLHRALDELAADYLRHNPGQVPSRTAVLELMTWSHQQTIEPTPTEENLAPGEESPV